ncbi:MAG: alpha/beta hydrolase family protein [Thermoguttaceae bacterium]
MYTLYFSMLRWSLTPLLLLGLFAMSAQYSAADPTPQNGTNQSDVESNVPADSKIFSPFLHDSFNLHDSLKMRASLYSDTSQITKMMMQSHLFHEIDRKREEWQRNYESLKTPEAITSYQQSRKEFLLKQLGEMWEKTPLNPQITKTLQIGTPEKNAYSVEMLLFESTQNFFVTGAVYIPDSTRFKPPYPAMLVVCGHSNLGKGYDIYQKVPALAASNGILTLVIDPIDQGERSQRLDEAGKPRLQGVPAHNLIGASCILLGRNAATFEVWDMIRAIDYLQSREDVIPDKIGVTGQSGGGTQTSYIMAIDDRVAVAAPSCYICGLYDKLPFVLGPQDAEQSIFGQLGFGMDHVDYCIMRAPKPTLFSCVTEDFFPIEDTWAAFRRSIRIYDKFGESDKMAICETDGKHGWHKTLRESTIKWMLRWLADRDERIIEADEMPIPKPEDFFATETGEVLQLPGAKSAFDLNRDYNDALLEKRNQKNTERSNEELSEIVRNLIVLPKKSEIPNFALMEKYSFSVESIPSCGRAFHGEFVMKNNEILLPYHEFHPQTDWTETVIYLNDAGKRSNPEAITKLLQAGNRVICLDLRGLGETQATGASYFNHAFFGPDGTDFYLAYLLGKTYVGMRTEDLISVASSLGRPTDIVADGEISSVVAIHATFLEPELFSNVRIKNMPRSWYDVVKQGDSAYPITNVVHGALTEYDIPDLIQRVGARITPF